MCVYACVYMYACICIPISIPTYPSLPYHLTIGLLVSATRIRRSGSIWTHGVIPSLPAPAREGMYIYMCVCMVVYGVRGCVYFQRTITITIASTKL